MKVDWIEGQGFDSNIFLIKNDKIVLVDAGTGLNSKRVDQKFREFGIKPEEIDILVNTHCHVDHSGGDSNILEASNCELMTSKPAAEALRTADGEATLGRRFGLKIEPLEVSRVLEEGDEIELGKSTLKILSTPGHSNGSISLYEPREKALFSGDVVFRGGIGRTDFPTSDPRAMKKSLQKLSKLDVEKLYPGHGPIAEEDAKKHLEFALNFFG
ncbi:hypothetical protein AKJ54_00060 [candidate division MSBL1 archaeon SCGC-AAA382K21]|uniref:Metallo-beta-lactamase domain-containing protein n=1 Tax=candidate division MSBL1 archaeon SCGC-AAA382K21 TaxID=1698283 RepID=A0A133VME0_9EURY|nr:hypothetical protein AKJ54_00060 [candidate division MSBL1 archaeon SCGC-AAA382K21]